MESSMSHSSSDWILPSEVMRNRKIKAKRRALHERMNTSLPLQILSPRASSKSLICDGRKRKNPFRTSLSNIDRFHDESDSSEPSNDGDLFQKLKAVDVAPSFNTISYSEISDKSVLDKKTIVQEPAPIVQCPVLIADWSLKTKMRFTSPTPIPWKHTFKSSEEASGTTGFVRCMDSEPETSSNRTLDTSKNAQLYQCCLVWQHPNLPWLSLFPREKEKITSQTGIFGTNKDMANCLLEDWKESLRSLFHLLRVRQCPYFYVCGSSFTCLFRAGGIGGIPHAHSFTAPTTFAFREAVRKEGIEFTMPSRALNKNQMDNSKTDENDEECLDDDETDEDLADDMSWLEDLGVEASKIPNINSSKQNSIPSTNSMNISNSLVYVEDMELLGYVNFLLNCTSCTSITGKLAGVPPTLLSPVGFHGSTLKSLKVNGSIVRTKDGKDIHSLEIRGPILPTNVLQLASIFSSNLDNYSINLLPTASSLPFCDVPLASKDRIPTAFAEEGLIDCGVNRDICSLLCKSNHTTSDLPSVMKEITYKNNLFSWK